MRTHYPINDKVLFTYPGVSIGDYDWSLRTRAQKSHLLIFCAIVVFAWGYFVLATTGNRLSLSEVSWAAILELLKSAAILALFPIALLPVFFYVRSKYPCVPVHRFYPDWARVFTGYGKGQHICFFAEHIEHFQLKSASFGELKFILVAVRFKPFGFPFLGRRGNERFGIRSDSETDLQLFQDWTRTNRIELIWEPEEQNQRRS